MRRILLALLICLTPLQSFAGLVMNTKMAGMDAVVAVDNASQAPCHEASQPMAADSKDCCGLQGVCQAMCHVVVAPMTSLFMTLAAPVAANSSAFTAEFQSADLRLGFKPPLL